MENNRAQMIERELLDIPVGKVRVVAWQSVVRWSESVFEIGTWGKKTSDLQDTVRKLEAI